MKIWGIVLALTILIGLLVPATPVSAGDTAWTIVTTPTTGKNQITQGTSVDFLVAAADGKTMFAYDNTGMKLYKSTDGGLTWSTLGIGAGLNGKTLAGLAISANFANDNTIAAIDSADVYMSTDGGKNFFSPLDIPAGAALVSVAIGPDYAGGIKILVGTSNGAGGGNMYFWTSRDYQLVAQSTVAGWVAGDVIAVAFSPNFIGDGQVLAVVATNAAGIALHNRLAAGAWEASAIAFTAAGNAAPGLEADIAFAADYGFFDNPYVLVGLNGSASDDLYRGRIGTASFVDLNIGGTGTTTSVNSVAVAGNIADAKVYAGLTDGKVAKGTNVTGSVTWAAPSTKAPSGTDAIAIVAGANVYAGTAGTGSAVYLSTDEAVTFNQISLISVTSTATLTFKDLAVVDANNMFIILEDGTNQFVFKTADAGATWTGISGDAAGRILGVYPSPKYATDNTLYIPMSNGRVLKSVNGGTSFSNLGVGYNTAVTAFAVSADGANFYAGSTNAVYKSGRYVQFGTLGSNVANSMVMDANGHIVVGTTTGDVYRSTDDGITFSLLGPADSLGAANPVVVALDSDYATSNTVYAGAAGGVYKFTAGTSTSWGSAMDANATSSVAISNDRNLYYGSTAGVRRALNPAMPGPAQGWDTVPTGPTSGYPAGAAVTSVDLLSTVMSGTNYQHDIYAVVSGVAGDATYPYAYRVIVFSDKLTNAVAVTAPAANAMVATNSTFTWAPYAGLPPNITPKYDVQIAYDAAFNNKIYDSAATPITGTLYVPTFTMTPGQTYYWRVRVAAANPLLSNWSPATKFSVKLAEAGDDLTKPGLYGPLAGATNVPIKPVFQWAAINGAQSYDLQVADNPVFVNPLDNQTGLNTTVWTYTKELENGKTYYWRVRAVAASGTASDWVAGSFTTAPKATATTTPTAPPASTITSTVTVTQTPAAKFFDPKSGLYFETQQQLLQYQQEHADDDVGGTPATPFYIWVIIAIGAILVIAVIVLIARTRRV